MAGTASAKGWGHQAAGYAAWQEGQEAAPGQLRPTGQREGWRGLKVQGHKLTQESRATETDVHSSGRCGRRGAAHLLLQGALRCRGREEGAPARAPRKWRRGKPPGAPQAHLRGQNPAGLGCIWGWSCLGRRQRSPGHGQWAHGGDNGAEDLTCGGAATEP